MYQCHRSVFVFDEVEKIPPGTLDVLYDIILVGKQGYYDYRLVFVSALMLWRKIEMMNEKCNFLVW